MSSKRLLPVLISSCMIIAGCSTTSTSPVPYFQDANQATVKENERLFTEETAQTSNITLADLIPNDSLRTLIEQALLGNPSLQRTALSLEASRWNVTQTAAVGKPQANLGLSANESENSDTRYSTNLNVSWEVDVWQRLADSTNAAEKSLASDQELFRASQATLVANVMKNWLELISNQRAINIEQQRLQLLETNETLIVQRFRNGLGTLENLDEAKTSTSQSRADLAQYKEELASNERALKILLGNSQTELLERPKRYPEIWLDLTALPNQNLALRPDLRAAYLNIEVADLQESVAYKDMLPSFSLSAALTDSSGNLRDALFTSPAWSLIGQLSAPLFQGKRLQANHEIAKLEVAQAFQEYRETLLTAVNEVENALGQELVLSQRRLHISSALHSAESNRQQYERKYRSGLVELSDLISAQQTVFNLQAELDSLEFQQLSNRIDLGLALGLGTPQL